MAPEAKIKVLRIPAPRTEAIRLRDLQVDEKYQRRVSPTHVDGMVAMLRGCSLNEILKKLSEYLGYLCVGRRADDTNKVVDGQQRCALIQRIAEELGFDDVEVSCEVFNSRGVKHEADVYNKRNHRKALSPADKFKGRVAEGDPVAVELRQILEDNNLGVSGLQYSKPVHKIKCVSTFEKALRLGGKKLVTQIISVINDVWGRTHDGAIRAWPEMKEAFKTQAVGGLAIFLNDNPTCSVNKLKKELSKFSVSAFLKRLDDEIPPGQATSGYVREQWAAAAIAKIYSPKENTPHTKVRGLTR
ncbi:hypothetical protein EBZ39_00380 [bacterium]|nr:hypothetical protein [bacterium]